MKLTKEQFMEAVEFIGQFAGYVDLPGEEAEEMWEKYEKEIK